MFKGSEAGKSLENLKKKRPVWLELSGKIEQEILKKQVEA